MPTLWTDPSFYLYMFIIIMSSLQFVGLDNPQDSQISAERTVPAVCKIGAVRIQPEVYQWIRE